MGENAFYSQGSFSVFQLTLRKNLNAVHRVDGVPSHTSLHGMRKTDCLCVLIPILFCSFINTFLPVPSTKRIRDTPFSFSQNLAYIDIG